MRVQPISYLFLFLLLASKMHKHVVRNQPVLTCKSSSSSSDFCSLLVASSSSSSLRPRLCSLCLRCRCVMSLWSDMATKSFVLYVLYLPCCSDYLMTFREVHICVAMISGPLGSRGNTLFSLQSVLSCFCDCLLRL